MYICKPIYTYTYICLYSKPFTYVKPLNKRWKSTFRHLVVLHIFARRCALPDTLCWKNTSVPMSRNPTQAEEFLPFLYGCCVLNQVLHLNTNLYNMPFNPRLPHFPCMPVPPLLMQHTILLRLPAFSPLPSSCVLDNLPNTIDIPCAAAKGARSLFKSSGKLLWRVLMRLAGMGACLPRAKKLVSTGCLPLVGLQVYKQYLFLALQP